MKAATLFSGIGAPEVAMPHWQWLWHAEIEKFPNAVMKHHFPQSKNLGDVNAEDFVERAQCAGKPDVIVFGSPCQSFSIAGRRLGLDDARGNLALRALAIVKRLKPGWFVFENVPGLLSSSEGRDFGLFLRAMDELGYSGCWSVLDAQYFGLAQRRERLFIVGSLGDWRGPASVLLEPESLCGNIAPRRASGQRVTGPIAGCANGGANGPGRDVDSTDTLLACHDLSPCLGASGRGFERAGDTRGQDAVVAWALQERDYKGADSSTKEGHLIVADPIQANEHRTYSTAGNNPRPRNIVFDETQITSRDNRCNPQPGDVCHPLAENARPPTLAFSSKDHGADAGLLAPTLRAMPHQHSHANGGGQVALAHATMVRRLTPMECEALQGFPRGYTAITYRGKPAADGPRYRALGNSMAVPVIRWILSRIDYLENQSQTKFSNDIHGTIPYGTLI